MAKYVIDISEEEYLVFKLAYESGMGNTAMKHILNATPLEEVLGEIKAEIRQVSKEEKSEDAKWARGLLYSLVVINKHISGKEKEDA